MASQMTSKIVITLITGLRPDRHAMIPVYHKMAFGMARCNGSMSRRCGMQSGSLAPSPRINRAAALLIKHVLITDGPRSARMVRCRQLGYPSA